MAQLGNIHISDSLLRLIRENHRKSSAIDYLNAGLNQLMDGYGTSSYLASALPGNYFAFREQEGMISFMPAGREQAINQDGSWSRRGRQSVKPAKWLRSMLNPAYALQLRDDHFEMFATVVKAAEEEAKLEMELVSVEDGYNKSLFSNFIDSCMWNKDVAPFYNLFGCKCVVAKGADGRYRGRALWWPKVKFISGASRTFSFMDRVYAVSSGVSMAMCDYALSQGWYHKSRQSREQVPFVMPGGQLVDQLAVVRTINSSVPSGALVDGDGDDVDDSDEDRDDVLEPEDDSWYAVPAQLWERNREMFYPYLDTFAFGGENYLSTNCHDLRGEFPPEFAYQATEGQRARYMVKVEGRGLKRASECMKLRGKYYLMGGRDPQLVVCNVSANYVLRSEAFAVTDYNGSVERWYHKRFVVAPGKTSNLKRVSF